MENGGKTKFIRVNGRVIPIKQDRLKTQAKIGAAAGLSQGVGLRMLGAGKTKTGAAFIGASVIANVGAEIKGVKDAMTVGKKAGFGAGFSEYAKQTLSRMGGAVAGGIAAPFALKATAKGLKKTAEAKRAWQFRKSTGLKDVTPSIKKLTSSKK